MNRPGSYLINHSRTTIYGPVVVVLMLSGIGCRKSAPAKDIEPVYDQKTGRLQLLKYDADHDGKPDTISYMDGARVLRIEIDKDEDGKVDRWEYYDASQQIEKLQLSPRHDGKPTRTEY